MIVVAAVAVVGSETKSVETVFGAFNLSTKAAKDHLRP